jgi:FtsP/CotA-like multicopper oxidase with cupredoxin domain
MGLYGTIVVEPTDPSYWPAVDRHLTLTLDDLLVEDGHIAPFHRSGPTYVAMGRYGNIMLTNGQPQFSGQAAVGEVVRLYVVNSANTRIFNFAVRGARAKLVGGDSGRYEREEFVEEVLLAPSERAVLDMLFDTPGDVRLEHRTPEHVYDLGGFSVTGTATGNAAQSFDVLRTDPDLTAVHQSISHDLQRPPDKVLAFFSRMPLLYGGDDPSADSYVCPMHPEVTATEPGTCPKCGMKLVPSDAPPIAPSEQHEGMAHSGPDHHEHDQGDGLEWEDLMPEINRASDSSNMIWQLIARPAPSTEPSAGRSRSVTGSRSGWSTRWMPTTRCITPCTCMAPAASWSSQEMASQRPTWCGRTPCSCAQVRPSTSCWTSPTLGCGWPTVISPSTTRAA